MKSTIHAKLLLEVQGGISILDKKKKKFNTLDSKSAVAVERE